MSACGGRWPRMRGRWARPSTLDLKSAIGSTLTSPTGFCVFQSLRWRSAIGPPSAQVGCGWGKSSDTWAASAGLEWRNPCDGSLCDEGGATPPEPEPPRGCSSKHSHADTAPPGWLAFPRARGNSTRLTPTATPSFSIGLCASRFRAWGQPLRLRPAPRGRGPRKEVPGLPFRAPCGPWAAPRQRWRARLAFPPLAPLCATPLSPPLLPYPPTRSECFSALPNSRLARQDSSRAPFSRPTQRCCAQMRKGLAPARKPAGTGSTCCSRRLTHEGTGCPRPASS